MTAILVPEYYLVKMLPHPDFAQNFLRDPLSNFHGTTIVPPPCDDLDQKNARTRVLVLDD